VKLRDGLPSPSLPLDEAVTGEFCLSHDRLEACLQRLGLQVGSDIDVDGETARIGQNDQQSSPTLEQKI